MLARLAGHPEAGALIDEEAQTRLWLGRALLARHRGADAEPELLRAVALRERLDDPASLWLAEARRELARARSAKRR